LLFGFLTSFFAPCREAAMCHHPFRLWVSLSDSCLFMVFAFFASTTVLT
jgi:hypothetical protein